MSLMIWWSLRAFLELFFGASCLYMAVNMHRHLRFFVRVHCRKRFLSRCVNYYPNSAVAFQLENALLTCGDIHPYPGYQAKADNSDSNAKSGSNSKSKFKFPCKVCDKPVKSNHCQISQIRSSPSHAHRSPLRIFQRMMHVTDPILLVHRKDKISIVNAYFSMLGV